MILALLLVAQLAGPPPPPDYPTAQRTHDIEKTMDGIAGDVFWIGVGGAGDLFTTAWALEACRGCREANPLGFNAEARISLKFAMTLAGVGVCYELRRSDHHGLATAVRWILFTAQALLVFNNGAHAIRRQ